MIAHRCRGGSGKGGTTTTLVRAWLERRKEDGGLPGGTLEGAYGRYFARPSAGVLDIDDSPSIPIFCTAPLLDLPTRDRRNG